MVGQAPPVMSRAKKTTIKGPMTAMPEDRSEAENVAGVTDGATERLLVVVTTSDDRSVLESISSRLVEIGLAGCCQISGPLTSVYRWQGKLERAQEFECRIKTTAARFKQIEVEITRLHNYDVPQIVGLPIAACSREYRNWLLGFDD